MGTLKNHLMFLNPRLILIGDNLALITSELGKCLAKFSSQLKFSIKIIHRANLFRFRPFEKVCNAYKVSATRGTMVI